MQNIWIIITANSTSLLENSSLKKFNDFTNLFRGLLCEKKSKLDITIPSLSLSCNMPGSGCSIFQDCTNDKYSCGLYHLWDEIF